MITHAHSPYACAKVYAFEITHNYREAYGLFARSGILFNHESERRWETFVTRKITRAIGRIHHGLQKELHLGNLEARRDWGRAEDYVEAIGLMLQQARADDYVVGTNETHSVREFLDEAFGLIGRDWRDTVKIDPRYFRPAEVAVLLVDASRARNEQGWKPKVGFKQLVRRMVEHDLEIAGREKRARG